MIRNGKSTIKISYVGRQNVISQLDEADGALWIKQAEDWLLIPQQHIAEFLVDLLKLTKGGSAVKLDIIGDK